MTKGAPSERPSSVSHAVPTECSVSYVIARISTNIDP